jgi:hypothetical protein
MNLVKSQRRIAYHGEVFTPTWMVKAMLDLMAVRAIAAHEDASKEAGT